MNTSPACLLAPFVTSINLSHHAALADTGSEPQGARIWPFSVKRARQEQSVLSSSWLQCSSPKQTTHRSQTWSKLLFCHYSKTNVCFYALQDKQCQIRQSVFHRVLAEDIEANAALFWVSYTPSCVMGWYSANKEYFLDTSVKCLHNVMEQY